MVEARSLGRRALNLRWSLLVAAGLVLAVLTHTVGPVLICVGVILSVMIHEFGHYLTAKWSGMKVTEYFLGFGPRLWSFHKGETEYGVKAIPAGGYVRIVGMNNLEPVEPEDEARAYRQQPFWQRIIVVSAGSFMHFVIALVLMFIVLAMVGITTTSTNNTIGNISRLKSTSPAQAAGLREGDRVISVAGKPTDNWNAVVTSIAASPPGQPLALTIVRNGKLLDLSIATVERRTVVLSDGTQLDPNAPAGAAFLGVGPELVKKRESVLSAVPQSFEHVGRDSVTVVKTIGDVFSPSGIKLYAQNVTDSVPKGEEKKAENQRLLSPIGLGNYASHAADSGLGASLQLLYAINLFVGIFNMVPLLPFDGGHVAVAVYEKIRSIGRKRRYMADFNKLLPVSYAVLLILVTISVSSLYLDIVRPAANPFQ